MVHTLSDTTTLLSETYVEPSVPSRQRLFVFLVRPFTCEVTGIFGTVRSHFDLIPNSSLPDPVPRGLGPDVWDNPWPVCRLLLVTRPLVMVDTGRSQSSHHRNLRTLSLWDNT